MNVAISLIDTYNTNELKKVDNDKRIIDLEYLKEENKKHGIDKEYKLEIIGTKHYPLSNKVKNMVLKKVFIVRNIFSLLWKYFTIRKFCIFLFLYQ